MPGLSFSRLIDALQADKEKLEKLLETAKQEVRISESEADTATTEKVSHPDPSRITCRLLSEYVTKNDVIPWDRNDVYSLGAEAFFAAGGG